MFKVNFSIDQHAAYYVQNSNWCEALFTISGAYDKFETLTNQMTNVIILFEDFL